MNVYIDRRPHCKECGAIEATDIDTVFDPESHLEKWHGVRYGIAQDTQGLKSRNTLTNQNKLFKRQVEWKVCFP